MSRDEFSSHLRWWSKRTRPRGDGRVRLGKARFSRGQSNIAKSFLINNLRVPRRVRAEIHVCVSHTYTCIRQANHLYEIPGGGVEGWYTFWSKKGAEKRTARIKWRRIEEVSRIFAFRNAADAIYENVVRERDERKKGHSRGSVRRRGKGKNCLFYGVELRRTILSPTKWPGSIFGSLSSFFFPPRTPTSPRLFLTLSFSAMFAFSLFFSLVHPFHCAFSTNSINFRQRKVRCDDTQALVYAYFSVSSLSPTFKSGTRILLWR